MNTSFKYPDAIIYGIKCDETNEVYIGSTVRTLEHRMSLHRASAKRYNKWITSGSVGKRQRRCCSIQILNRNNYSVFEIETSPCNTLSELRLREGEFQMQYKSSMGALCINMCIAGALARAGGVVEYSKQRYIDNAEKIKQYKQTNATKIASRAAVKHNCSVCGGRYTCNNRAKHFKTKVHQDAMCGLQLD